MSRLSDVISEACAEARDADGTTVVWNAVNVARGRLDDDDRLILVDEALARRCKAVAERGKRSVKQAAERPSGIASLFPDLRQGYALGTDEKVVKETASLSEVEFRRLIAIREKQVEDDRAHLEVLRLAFETVTPIWQAHPDWTFGDCCRAHGASTPDAPPSTKEKAA